MMNYNLLRITMLIVIAIGISSCKKRCYDPKNVECDNYDPCYGKTRINSNFRVRPGDGGFPAPEQWCELMPCDTFNASSVRFDVPINNPNNSTYTWQIGSEPSPRKSIGFEVDFSDYLDAGNWETHIPITLTIRTPLNYCMTNKEDTLIKVKRDLFFTKAWKHPFSGNPGSKVFEGYLLEKPNETFRIKTEFNNEKYYKKLETYGNNFFFIGFPFADTILRPWSIFVKDDCSNFKHFREITDKDQNPQMFELFNEYSHGLMQQDFYYLGDTSYLFKLEFH
ncbi:MAG TPA: hypothetical protein VGF79_06660, partial [Bacteroidia bacterium]